MKVIICGAGVIGVTSAYALASRGHEVEVIERNAAPAMETSFANGGQLSYNHAEPWANPTSLRNLPRWLLHEDSPLIFRLRADFPMYLWGTQFLLNCQESTAHKHTIDILKLGLYSKQKLAEIRKATQVEFDFQQSGVLHIYSNSKDLDQAAKQAEFQHRYGGDEKIISSTEAIALEPALADAQIPLAGAIHAHLDESGDPKKYCDHLAAYASKHLGVVFHYNTTIQELVAPQDKITHLKTDKGDFKGDAYVMALSSYSPLLLRKVGVHIPVYPMKGYSITVPRNQLELRMSITDGSHKIVFTQLGNVLRVAGTAEFAGYNTNVIPSRMQPILKASRKVLPKVDWEQRAEWACLRPSTPDSLPRIGKTKLPNLFLNTGHGTLGWTQAAGSAYLLADIMDGKTPELIIKHLTF